MARISILHASDLHIAEEEKLISFADARTRQNLSQAVRTWDWSSSWDATLFRAFASLALELAQAEEIQGVIITGDVATTGLSEDLSLAYDILYGPYSRQQKLMGPNRLPTLGALKEYPKIPLMILPGNHDGYKRRKRPGYDPGGNEFDTYFMKEWQGPVMVYPPLESPGIRVQIIGADFRLQSASDKEGRWPFTAMGQGRVYASHLAQLENETQRIKAARPHFPPIVVWAVHFPPLFPGGGTLLKLVEGEKLAAAAKRQGVAAILAGHTHEQVKYCPQGMSYEIFCCGTTTQYWAPTGNYCQIISFETERKGVKIESEVFQFDGSYGGSGGFVTC